MSPELFTSRSTFCLAFLCFLSGGHRNSFYVVSSSSICHHFVSELLIDLDMSSLYVLSQFIQTSLGKRYLFFCLNLVWTQATSTQLNRVPLQSILNNLSRPSSFLVPHVYEILCFRLFCKVQLSHKSLITCLLFSCCRCLMPKVLLCFHSNNYFQCKQWRRILRGIVSLGCCHDGCQAVHNPKAIINNSK